MMRISQVSIEQMSHGNSVPGRLRTHTMEGQRFNIRNDEGQLLCPACGFPSYAERPAYDEQGGVIGTTICPCCLWEPGFDDNHGASENASNSIRGSLRSYRRKFDVPMVWRGRADQCPREWDGRKQISDLFKTAPFVR